MSQALALATTFWGLLMGLAPVLQIRVILRDRDASGTSLGWVVVLLVGFVLWLAYGVMKQDVPIVVTNIVAVVVTAMLLAVVLRHTTRSRSRAAS
jgi:MtN3 and saliva related transmembrane protein